MAWIESHQELGRHPKMKKLARILNIAVPTAVGHLHFFWWWALDYAQDGSLSRYDAGDIADAALWEQDAQAFVDAMVEAGFIDRDQDGTLRIHDWDDYAGRLLDKRRQNAERKRRSRARHAPVTRDSRNGHRATVPNRTVPNHIDTESSSQQAPMTTSETVTPGALQDETPETDGAERQERYPETSQEYILAALLRNMIIERHPRARVPPGTVAGLRGWCRHVNYMIRIDGRDPPEIEQVIRWSQKHPFWQTNILSTKKLREKYDTLLMQMLREEKSRGNCGESTTAETRYCEYDRAWQNSGNG